MIQAILWDNDGVLVNTESIHFEVTRSILASVGMSLTKETYVDLYLVRGRSAWDLASAHDISEAVIARLRTERDALYLQRLANETFLIDGVARVLATLHERYAMGIVTGSRREHLQMVHRDTGLLNYLRFAVTFDDCKNTKPDREPYDTALRWLGLPPHACLAVEDSQRGLTSALAAGVRCVVIPSDLTRGSTFEGAECVMGSISELPIWLKTHP
jgi:HAD superfamily hydrolase (TIGR01509 family)